MIPDHPNCHGGNQVNGFDAKNALFAEKRLREDLFMLDETSGFVSGVVRRDEANSIT